jgi:predicted transcriptional regulator of viral defense system
MRPAEAYARLQGLHRPVFANAEAVAALRLDKTATAHALAGLARDGLIVKLRQGLWAIPNSFGGRVDPLEVLPMLTRPYPSYSSLWTALAAHDMIEQIPRAIHAVSLDRAREMPTSIGTFRVHRVTPELYGGIEGATEIRAGTATPEKALFDTVYLLVARTGHGSLPEIEIPNEFDVEALYSWADRVASARWRTLTVRYLTALGLPPPPVDGAVRRREQARPS